MKTALINGVTGQDGSYLAEHLLELGYRVVGLVRRSATPSLERLASCLDRLEFAAGDLIDLSSLVRVLQEHQPDEIYNLACPASPIHYQHDPVQTTRTSVHGAINMLGLAKRTGAKILQASTSEVYGDPEVHPQTEDYLGNVNPIGLRGCYDEGKRCAETLFFDYYRQYGTNIRVARIFNTYGPRMHPDDGRVVSNFIVQALKGQPITVYGNGSQTRSFCYVSDLVGGLVALMDAPDEITGPVNLGNPREMTIRELAEQVIAMTGSKSKLVEKPLPGYDPTQRCPDITRAKTQLGWTPGVMLEDGLKTTIDYFKTTI